MKINPAQVLLETLRISPQWNDARLREAWLRMPVEGLRELVSYEQITIWLYCRIKEIGVGDELPPSFWTWLIRRARVESANGLLVEAEAIRIAELLRAGGVPAVFLKGIARRLLADRFPYIDARPTIDVDVLLPADQASSVWEDLKRSGYKFVADPALTPVDLWHLVPLAGANRVAVELHTSTSREVRPADAWRRYTFEATGVKRGDLELRVPSATEMLWHSIIHAQHDGINAWRLKCFQDAATLMTEDADIDWEIIAERLNSVEIRDRGASVRWLTAGAELAGRPLPPSITQVPRPFPLLRVLRWRLAALRRAGERPRLLEKLLDEGTRAELRLPMQEQVAGIGSGLRVRRRSATLVARSIYYAWRIARG
ncbi:MAG TPA: nucleotidyltransferase family protein [Gemmatimonadales bacterium]|nr:nucleotidyltransferase family protein [Gemmatimonadales bacterium]